MASRSVSVVLRANVSGFTAEMAKARQSLDDVVKASDKNARVADTAGGRMVQSARLQADEWNRVGNTLTAMGAAGTVALGGAAKAAISYESAFAGVKKTVNATPAEIDKLSNSIRSMSREMPASQTEIAGVAEAAGQLGIEVRSVDPDDVDHGRHEIVVAVTHDLERKAARKLEQRVFGIGRQVSHDDGVLYEQYGMAGPSRQVDQRAGRAVSGKPELDGVDQA